MSRPRGRSLCYPAPSMEVGINRVPALIIALGFALTGGASALPGSYGREHAAECAATRATSDNARVACATREWCAVHKGEDRISHIACDPMQSRADQKKPRLTLSAANLGANL